LIHGCHVNGAARGIEIGIWHVGICESILLQTELKWVLINAVLEMLSC